MSDWAYEQRKLEIMHPCELDARDDSHWTMEKELAARKREEERAAKKKKDEPWVKVAKSLCVDLDNNIDDVAKRLKKWGEAHNFTPEQVEELCKIDRTYIFNQIY